MKTIGAVQTTANEPLIIDELDTPSPGPDQVLLKLFATGVCHSQLHQMHSPDLPRPLVLGHEATGVVTQIGRNVKHVREGDHTILSWVSRSPFKGRRPFTPPGTIYQGKLINDALVYTWARDVLVSAEYVIPISRKIPTEVTAVVGCAVLTGAGAVMNTANVRPGDSVAIFGVGGVGLSAVQTASLLEAFPIIAVDLNSEKLDFAREFGATHTIDASQIDPVRAVIEMTDGGVDYSFDAIGVRATTEQILPVTRGGGPGAENHGGMAILVGIPGEEMTLDPRLFTFHQRRFRGSLGAIYPERDFPLLLRWYEEGKFPLEKLVTRRYKLEQINEAYQDLADGKILGRAIIVF